VSEGIVAADVRRRIRDRNARIFKDPPPHVGSYERCPITHATS
jgi:hypothetical protein